MKSGWYDAHSAYAIGVDIGGTKINAGIVSRSGEVLYSISFSTLAGQTDTGGRVLEAVQGLLKKLELEQPNLRIRGIGVGSAGQIDWSSGQIRFASDLIPGYQGTQLKKMMEEHFSMPVRVDNDVNVLALTEKRFGAGKGIDHFICLALGTGVGGAIVVDGRLVHGAWGGAGELGHMSVNFQGPLCICGGRGCLEQYASGTSIARRMREKLEAEGIPVEKVDTREVFARWHAGDRLANAIMEETIAALGTGIASLIHTFNPGLIVIGGGVAEAGELLFDRLRQEVSNRTMASMLETVRIEPAYKGNWGGMIGAALQIWEYADGGEQL
ncbi:ROK family protein [Paenibacillus planticolens]|uniref:ROK family protein n=1 Tax=Paenibacillus planticolens TaxID=2654976 RepID=A0ABX1ZKV0_9BACL|nr:ROK family protein [Paenibacillus planticolens]NOV00717.1 ROK family protein [Paenibacillus planticolens]